MLGFDGKTLIHPKQISVCNQAFSPREEEIINAQNLIALWEKGAIEDVTLHEGRLVEALHIEQAKQLLALNEGLRE